MNISSGASNTSSTSAGFGLGMNAFLSVIIPITGTTLRRCCKENRTDHQQMLLAALKTRSVLIVQNIGYLFKESI